MSRAIVYRPHGVPAIEGPRLERVAVAFPHERLKPKIAGIGYAVRASDVFNNIMAGRLNSDNSGSRIAPKKNGVGV